MKKEIVLWGMDENVTIEDTEIKPVVLNNGSRYEEAAITDDGRLIAFDDAVCDWVQLGLKNDLGYTFIDKEEAETIAKQIRESETWDNDLNRELCELAGLEDEYNAADGDSFEAVVFEAAEILGVEIN